MCLWHRNLLEYQAGVVPSATSGLWYPWAQAKTLNAIHDHYEVDGVYYVNVGNNLWTGSGFTPYGSNTGEVYLSIACAPSGGTGSVSVFINESFNLWDSTTKAWQYAYGSPQSVHLLYSHSLSGACGQSYLAAISPTWYGTTLVPNNCGGGNCTLALYFQFAFAVSSTNDADTIGCLDFYTQVGSCSGVISGASQVDLNSVAVT